MADRIPFRPDELSGMSEAELLPIIEAAAGISIARIKRLSPSTGGDKFLLTVHYKTPGGDDGAVSVFVKRCVWQNRPESVHYRYLAAHGIPMPRLYGAFRRGTDPESVFLEMLPSVGFNKNSDAEWRTLLTLMARFNACPLDTDYLPRLRPYEQVGRIDENRWLLGLPAFPTDDEMAAAFGSVGVPVGERDRLTTAAHALFARVASHPRGLLHQDFLPDNFGWRRERAEMVIFDVPKNALGPRFADVAPYLFVSDWAAQTAAFLSHAGDGTTRQEALVQHYLDEYAIFGGPNVLPETFHQEIRELFWAHKVAAMSALPAGRVFEVLEFVRGFLPLPYSIPR